MLNRFKINTNGIKYILIKPSQYYFIKKSEFNTTSVSKLILDAHQSCFLDLEKTRHENLFSKYSNDLKECIFSKQEAASALKLCLDLNHFDRHLFRNIIKVLEDEYFKPILVEDSTNTFEELQNIAKQNPSNTFKFINSLSVKDKSTIVIWSWLINRDGRKHKRIPKIDKPTEAIDPEKHEIYITKKTKKVLDPIPIRASLSYMSPGKKLSNMLSVQLREHVNVASISELCQILHIFSTPMPLTGQLNEDTIDLISNRFCQFGTLDLAKNMFSVSSFCRYASNRFHDIWSFIDHNINRLSTRNRLLYGYEVRKLPNKFVKYLLDAIDKYINDDIQLENYKDYINETSDISVHLHIINHLSNSDIEISVNIWEKLIIKISGLMDNNTSNKYDIKEIGLFCDSVLKAKYTTPNTMEFGKRILKGFTIAMEYTNDDFYLLAQILNYIIINDISDECTDVINCVLTLAINNTEKLKFEQKVLLLKYLEKLSHYVDNNDLLELRLAYQ